MQMTDIRKKYINLKSLQQFLMFHTLIYITDIW